MQRTERFCMDLDDAQRCLRLECGALPKLWHHAEKNFDLQSIHKTNKHRGHFVFFFERKVLAIVFFAALFALLLLALLH